MFCTLCMHFSEERVEYYWRHNTMSGVEARGLGTSCQIPGTGHVTTGVMKLFDITTSVPC